MKPLFDKSGGYRKLNSFHFATLINLATIDFCKRFISYKDDPLGKTVGQMIGAARSGRQNIIEGSERAATSKETEMKLTDVARASLAELLGDYEMFLAERGVAPWSKHSAEHQAVSQLNFSGFSYSDDTLHNYWQWFHQQRVLFSRWLTGNDPCLIANTLIILIQRAMAMLSSQIQKQGEMFLETGGFRERLTQQRMAARDQNAPTCPKCNGAMRRRTAQKGVYAGQAFWSCANYPQCKGTRPLEKGRTQDSGHSTKPK